MNPPPTSRSSRLRPRTAAAVGLGQLVARASRRLGRGAGEILGGKVALRLDDTTLQALGGGRQTILVSATNGKTTTTRLISAACAVQAPVVTNGGGANMAPGIVSALAARPRDTRGVLEVDELHLPAVARALRPRVLALLNLSRDQLDRSNETRRIAGRWRSLGTELPATTVVANADDPLVAWAADGFTEVRWVHAGQAWTSDAMVCPRCAALLRRDVADAGGSAHWECPRCGLHRPAASLGVAGPGELLVDGSALPVGLALPGRCNVANAAVALAVSRELGFPDAPSLAAMRTVTTVAGRYEVVDIAGRAARLLLAKNPAGWLEMLELIETEPPRPVIIDFNARVADGRDPSWIWDVPVQRLARRPVLVSGDRAADVVTRLRYAGVDASQHVAVADAVRAAPRVGDGVDVLATYTAFRELLLAYGGSGTPT